MRKATLAAVAILFGTTSGFSQNAAVTSAPRPATSGAAADHAAHAAPAKPAATASTPESRSAAALALSHDPTYDEGTAKRIREAALSYSDLAVRGKIRIRRTGAS